VQEAMGGRQEGAIEHIAGPAQRRHAPRPLEEVGGDVLEEGAGHTLGPAEDGVGPVAAGADAPDVEGKAAGALVQEFERRLDVAVEEYRWRAAGAEAAEVDGQGMVAGSAQGRNAAPQIEVGPSPDQPGREEEDGAAGGALRRIPGRPERARTVTPRHLEVLEGRQPFRRVRLGNLGQPRRQRQETAHCNPLQPGAGPSRYRDLLHHTPLPSTWRLVVAEGLGVTVPAIQRVYAGPFAASAISHRRLGLRGISRISRPGMARAFSTAWAKRAPTGMAPASPAPLVPRALRGEAVSSWPTSTRGTSSAVGRRKSMKEAFRSWPLSS